MHHHNKHPLRLSKVLQIFCECSLLALVLACTPDRSVEFADSQVDKAKDYTNLNFLAGRLGGRGNADGQLGRFDKPIGIAVGADGTLYVSDRDGEQIRIITTSGMVASLTGISKPYVFDYDREPENAYVLIISSKGILYMVDKYQCQIRQITTAGEVRIFAGQAGCGYADGHISTAQFGRIGSIVFDRFDNMFVADTSNYVIRKISAQGEVSTLAGDPGENGVLDGLGSSERFLSTYRSDMLGKRDGVGRAARFLWPMNLAIDQAGGLYVSDGYKVLRKVSAAGEVSTFRGMNEDGSVFQFTGLTAMVTDSSDNLFAVDGNTIKRISNAGIVSVYAGGGRFGNYEGNASTIGFSTNIQNFPGDNVAFWNPGMLAIDRNGNLYFANALQKIISKITPNRQVFVVAGKYENVNDHFRIDGQGAAASFTCRSCWDSSFAETEYRVSMTSDSTGNVYVNDQNFILRKVTPNNEVSTMTDSMARSYGGVIARTGVRYWFENGRFYKFDPRGANPAAELIAGDGSNFDFSDGRPIDGIGNAAVFFKPIALTTDQEGNAYQIERKTVHLFDDQQSVAGGIIRKISPDGRVQTIAGDFDKRGYQDGAGLSALFSAPSGLAVDRSGNLYIADTYNHVIRKLDRAGFVTTFAGTPMVAGSIDGDRKQARFNNPCHLVFDSEGNLYVADNGNYLIRKISRDGRVSTVVGKAGVRGVMPGSLPTSISTVLGMTIDGNDDLLLFSEYSVLKVAKFAK